MTDKMQIGELGEDYACEYLKNLGYEIICRNYRSAEGEIDIIAQDKDEIAFVEVRARKYGGMVSPIESVNYKKRIKIIKTAEQYINENDLDCYCRFDVFEVYTHSTEPKRIKAVNYIKRAFDGKGRN